MFVMKYINLAVPEELHKKIKIQAAEEGVSMTAWVNNKINKKEAPDKKPLEIQSNPLVPDKFDEFKSQI